MWFSFPIYITDILTSKNPRITLEYQVCWIASSFIFDITDILTSKNPRITLEYQVCWIASSFIFDIFLKDL